VDRLEQVEIIAAGLQPSSQDWSTAMRTPLSELPDLSEDELHDAKRLGLNPDSRRRSLLMRHLAKVREQAQGQQLGEYLLGLLRDLHSDFQVLSLKRTSPPDGWFVRLTGDNREVQFVLELATVHRLLIGSVSNRELRDFHEQIKELVEPRSLLKAAQ
jgi:hypothetical protein